eukprot:1639100-Heterocapsa_arctica.AAC.1
MRDGVQNAATQHSKWILCGTIVPSDHPVRAPRPSRSLSEESNTKRKPWYLADGHIDDRFSRYCTSHSMHLSLSISIASHRHSYARSST